MAETKVGEDVTITFSADELKTLLFAAKSQPRLHGLGCPHCTSWCGECNCWVSKARKALEGSKA